MSTDGPPRIELGQIEVPKAADVLAEELRERICSGSLPPGAMLPPERDLVAETGLSRMTVRSALRLLETQGFVVTRPGRNGGSMVRLPGTEEVSRHLDVFIRGRSIPLEILLETREALDPMCARLAALRRTPADLDALEESNRRMAAVIEDLPTYVAENLRWHLLVARSSGNDLLISFMEAISKALHDATFVATFNSAEVRQTALRAHERVTAAIGERDLDAAERRMVRHACGFKAAILEHPDAVRDIDVRGELAESRNS